MIDLMRHCRRAVRRSSGADHHPNTNCSSSGAVAALRAPARVCADELLCEAVTSSVVRLVSGDLRSGSASSARARDRAEREVDDPALHGHVRTPLVALENLGEGRRQGLELLVLLGLNGLDLRGVAEALEQLAELSLAFLRGPLPGRQ